MTATAQLTAILAANAAAGYPDLDRSPAAQQERARHQAYLARKNCIEGLPPPDAFEAQLIRHLVAGDISPAQYITLIRLHSPS